MVLVSETMFEVSSAAFVLMVPAGVANDPEGLTGTSAVLSDLVFRGAGCLDNRALNEALDNIGLHRGSGVASLHSSFSGALVSDNLLRAMELHSHVVREPILAPDHFESCRALALQALDSLDDDPRQKVSLFVHEQFFPYPLGRWTPGKRDELQKLTSQAVKSYWADRFAPDGAILAVAGNVDIEVLRDSVEEIFGSWQLSSGRGECAKTASDGNVSASGGAHSCAPMRDFGPTKAGMCHNQNDGAQVHIGLMYPSVNLTDPDYYKALAAVGVLSGGMGSRLFTEVREKRGLCYAVMAAHQLVADYGAVSCYLGSSPENAQEALDVMIAELIGLADGIDQDELDRAKVGLRASLIMQGESTMARAASCARDFYYLNRVRSLEELENAISDLSVEDVLDYAKRYRPSDFAIATIGPKQLELF